MDLPTASAGMDTVAIKDEASAMFTLPLYELGSL
jgi:hypothetical protein